MFRARIALAIVLLIGSLGLGASCNRNNTTPAGSSGSGGDGSGAAATSDGGTGAGAGSGASAAMHTVPNLDLAALSNAEKQLFWSVADDELSPCGDPHPLPVCARDNTCRTCLPALRFLARRVQDGFPREELGDLVRARYNAGGDYVRHINTGDAPARGPATAPVTLVEFSDYECPHCGHAAPVLRDIEREFGDRLRVIHMHFPLSGHIHAMAASRAAVAAGKQGKFWEYHDMLFANQSAMEPADLERYATQLGLDLNRFRADAQSPETEAAVAANRREGERLQIDGTPTVYINGRKYPPSMPLERGQLREWIQEEIDTHP